MKKISLPIYIVSLIIVLLICGLLICLILSNKQENKSLKEEPTVEDIYIEFGYIIPVVEAEAVYPAPEPKQWKYTITKDGSLYYYSNFERGKEIEYSTEDKDKGTKYTWTEKLGGDVDYDYQSKVGKTFIRKLDDDTMKQIEKYIDENGSTEGSYYITKIEHGEKNTTYCKDIGELEKMINE